MAIERVAALDAHAQTQHGLVTTAQATAALGPSRKARWVSERRLVSVQPAVFRMAGAPETWHQALHAIQLATDGTVSHRAAAELWSLLQPAGYLDVSVLTDRRPRVRPPAIVHRIKDLHPSLAVEREEMMITDPVRTIVDLGLVAPVWTVRRALSQGLSSRLLTVADVRHLREALGRQGRNGTGIIGDILDERLVLLGDEESELEERLTRLVKKHRLSAVEVQHEVWSMGRFVARVDAAIPPLKLAIEVDGYEHHSSPEAFQQDRTRQNHLVGLGWTVLRFTWADVVKNPAQVARTIRAAMERLEAA